MKMDVKEILWWIRILMIFLDKTSRWVRYKAD